MLPSPLQKARLAPAAALGFVLSLGLFNVGCGGSSTSSTDSSGGAGSSVVSFGGKLSSQGGSAATTGSAQGGSVATATSSGGASAASSGGASAASSQCNNGIDDDGDGLIDGFDPECTGPLDNDESSYATGIPGDNRDPKWQDCFFDGNSGAGDDGCRYSTDCLTGKLPSTDPACSVTAACIKFCSPLTQNGCDCFGCCSVALSDGSSVDVLASATCSLANVGDTKACPRCQKSVQCGNDCGECELCAGKTAADLPASCTPATPPDGTPPPPAYTCDAGETVCGPDLPACPIDQFCSLGCCIVAIR